MVGHHHEGMEPIALEADMAVVQCLDHQLRDLGLPQEDRSAGWLIQNPLHGREGSAGSHANGRENTAGGKTSVQAEGDK